MENITLATNAKEVLAELLKEFEIETDDEKIEDRLSVTDCHEERKKLWKAIKNNVVETFDEMKKQHQWATKNSCENFKHYEEWRSKYNTLLKKVEEIAETLPDSCQKRELLALWSKA